MTSQTFQALNQALKMKKVVIVMGVSGCGKSTIGQALAQLIPCPFFDGDDFHPKQNIQKMSAGQALNDEDRWPWLDRLQELAEEHTTRSGAVIACSALKEIYRQRLSVGIKEYIQWVYLHGDYETIRDRMKKRKHFMPAELLRSQFDTLEEPTEAIRISIDQSPDQILATLSRWSKLGYQ